MHGILLAELERYVDAKYGDATWHALLDEAGLRNKVYSADATYPEADLVALVRAVPAITPVPISVLAEDFGTFLAPALLARCARLIEPEHRTLDVVERTEALYNEAMPDPAAVTALTRGHRASDLECVLTYASPRKLCALVRGVVNGIALHFGDTVSVHESACMLTGAAACEIFVRVAPR
jgi:hypothetical protein